jgi:hypothetical protein
VYRKSRHPPEKVSEPERTQETLKLTDQYLALLILVFEHAGLLDVSYVYVLAILLAQISVLGAYGYA